MNRAHRCQTRCILILRCELSELTNRQATYADQLIARVAVDTGAVRIVEGVLHICDAEHVEPTTMERITEYMPEVLRSVGQLARAKEYGETHRQASAESEAA